MVDCLYGETALQKAGDLSRRYPASHPLRAGIGLQQTPVTHVWIKQVQMMMTMTANAAAVTGAISDCFLAQTY